MKCIHLSDLHLGKRLNGFSLMEDQKYILQQILQIAEQEKAEAVLIAGDVYDKAIPSAEAVQLFDSFLTRLADQGHKVFLISGNHDSAERLSFGGALMQGRGVYVAPVYDGKLAKVCLTDEYGVVNVYLLPFLKPSMVRHALSERLSEEELPQTYQEAVWCALQQETVDESERNILLAHQFVTGAGRCESEEVVVGGLDNVDASLFKAFDYVALGHIHSPQWVDRSTVRYCGTPLKYSFSEAGQTKSVTVAELLEKGHVELRTVALTPLRELAEIKGSYLEVMARDFYPGKKEDYLHITLTDEEDVPDAQKRLQLVYPNLMQLSYDNSRTRRQQELEWSEDIEEKLPLELFCEFFALQNNRPVSEEQKRFLEELFERREV